MTAPTGTCEGTMRGDETTASLPPRSRAKDPRAAAQEQLRELRASVFLKAPS